eukprot:1590857-Rhodomonas_salina.1
MAGTWGHVSGDWHVRCHVSDSTCGVHTGTCSPGPPPSSRRFPYSPTPASSISLHCLSLSCYNAATRFLASCYRARRAVYRLCRILTYAIVVQESAMPHTDVGYCGSVCRIVTSGMVVQANAALRLIRYQTEKPEFLGTAPLPRYPADRVSIGSRYLSPYPPIQAAFR